MSWDYDMAPICDCCMVQMEPSVIVGSGDRTEVLEYACHNRDCKASPFYISTSKKNDSKPFDFEQYKKFRKRCKKRSKR